jgi:hypothetical protein
MEWLYKTLLMLPNATLLAPTERMLNIDHIIAYVVPSDNWNRFVYGNRAALLT